MNSILREVMLHLLILVLQFVGLGQEGLLLRIRQIVPHLSQPLGYISNAQTGVLSLYAGPFFCTEQEKSRPGNKKIKTNISVTKQDKPIVHPQAIKKDLEISLLRGKSTYGGRLGALGSFFCF